MKQLLMMLASCTALGGCVATVGPAIDEPMVYAVSPSPTIIAPLPAPVHVVAYNPPPRRHHVVPLRPHPRPALVPVRPHERGHIRPTPLKPTPRPGNVQARPGQGGRHNLVQQRPARTSHQGTPQHKK